MVAAVAAVVLCVLCVCSPAATAQNTPDRSTSAADYRECRTDALEDRFNELEAARRCVPDGARFFVCLGKGRPAVARVIACVNAQVPGAYPGDRLPVPRDDTTTTTERSGEPGSTTTSASAVTTTPAVTGTTVESAPAAPLGPAVAEESSDENGGGSGAGAVVLAVLAGLIAGLAVGILAGRRMSPTPDPMVPTGSPAAGGSPGRVADPPPTGPHAAAPLSAPTGPGPFPVDAPPAGQPPVVDATGDRDRLVAALIEVADEVSSDAVRTGIAQRLSAVGVEAVVVAPGERFDASTQRGVHAEPAPSPDRADTVVSTERPGWTDRGKVLRPPEVVVYRWEGDGR
ncbi:MAG: hypothetical protein KDB02_04920 [Acidimicrobiales bacterium]|nr:hypothetical protein [Acidimicrobiales bacterium]